MSDENDLREIERHECRSSDLARIAYHTVSHTLYVEFHNGSKYAYHHVPPFEVQLLLAAESQGRYFTTMIRNEFHCERIW